MNRIALPASSVDPVACFRPRWTRSRLTAVSRRRLATSPAPKAAKALRRLKIARPTPRSALLVRSPARRMSRIARRTWSAPRRAWVPSILTPMTLVTMPGCPLLFLGLALGLRPALV
jgi:hypothetical protein